MSFRDKHTPKGKAKILERNHTQRINQLNEAVHQQQRDLISEQQAEARTTTEAPTTEEVVWSARTQDIRNRITGKKRQAADRWNRFAGTGESGGRGR